MSAGLLFPKEKGGGVLCAYWKNTVLMDTHMSFLNDSFE